MLKLVSFHIQAHLNAFLQILEYFSQICLGPLARVSPCVLTTIKKITLAASHRIRKQEHRRSHNENGTVGRERRSIWENELPSSSSFTENCLLQILYKNRKTHLKVLYCGIVYTDVSRTLSVILFYSFLSGSNERNNFVLSTTHLIRVPRNVLTG